MEPTMLTTAFLATIIWENFGQPILDSAKTKYGDKILSELSKRLPFNEKENELIEAEIIEAVENNIITDEETFIKFIEKNRVFNASLVELQKKSNNTEIIESFKKISDSDIRVKGKSKKIEDSFKNINNSKIDI